MTTESTPGALGSNDQLGAGDARYCYSTDEENYFGDFATREDALAEGTAELDGHDEPGETRTVWTGVQRHAMHFLRRSAKQIGIDFAERIDEWLADNIAAEDSIVNVADPDAFGAALLALLEQHATFDSWAVADVQEHAVIVPGEPEAPNGGGEAPATARGER